MDWNKMMVNELRKAQVEVRYDNVPKRKCASVNSLLELEREISSQLSANDAMCSRSMALAATVSVN